MELRKIIPGKSLDEPVCTRKDGKAPAQHVDLEEFDQNVEKRLAAEAARTSEEFDDEESYGSDGYNDDELAGLSSVDSL